MFRDWIGEDDPEVCTPCCWCVWDMCDDGAVVVDVDVGAGDGVGESVGVGVVVYVIAVMVKRRKRNLVCW